MTDTPRGVPLDEPPAEAADAPDDAPSDLAAEVPADSSTDAAADAPTDAPTDVSTDAPGQQRRPRPRVARRAHWGPRTRIAVASLALTAMMFLFVFPTRSYFAQKRQVGRAANAVAVLRAQNQELARQAARLKTPSEIERLAREQFNMVRPGEQAYNVVETPAGSESTTTTTVP